MFILVDSKDTIICKNWTYTFWSILNFVDMKLWGFHFNFEMDSSYFSFSYRLSLCLIFFLPMGATPIL